MGEGARWVSGGRGKRGSLLVVTSSALDDVAALLSRQDYFVLACQPEVAARAMSLFRFGALVLDEDLSTLQCSTIARAFAAQTGAAPILHCWRGYPGGVAAMIAEHAQDAMRPAWPPTRSRRRLCWTQRARHPGPN
jgi:hypothetical protein